MGAAALRMTFTFSLCSVQALEKFFLLVALRTASPETLPGRQLPRPACCCGQEHRGGRRLPRRPFTAPMTRVVLIPHLAALGGVGDSLPNRKKGTSQALLGCLLCTQHCASPSTSSISFSPHDILGGRWSHAVHWPGEEAGSERVSHLPEVTQLEPGFQLNSS